WIFLSHQVGAALAAILGGWIHDLTGSYSWAFISAAFLAFIAAGFSLAIREEPVTKAPAATGVPVHSKV
ncbi:MAG: Major facilitator superfamily MFS-1, partial [Alphaproteobacteria bacterium]